MAEESRQKKASIFTLLTPYKWILVLLILFTLVSNGINLALPKIISWGIDSFAKGTFNLNSLLVRFISAVIIIFIFSYLQSIIQTYASEKVARDLRSRLSDIISQQNFSFIHTVGPSKLLTNLTADVDSIKLFVSQAIVSMVSSVFIIIGASILLLTINWKLALIIILIIPIIGITFFVVLKKVRALFGAARGVIDSLNRVITESIIGAPFIRVINAQMNEYDKFLSVNNKAKELGLSIMRMFAILIPVITFTAGMANLAILVAGGHYVITGEMTMGDFAAFSSYLALLIFPILVIGFMSNVIAQATASFDRIQAVLQAPPASESGTLNTELHGNIEVKDISLKYDQKSVLKNVSFSISPGQRIAIIGPTAAGKTQLLNLLTGLIQPASGYIHYDGHPISDYLPERFYAQLGLVFQDSVIFNLSIRENIAFSDTVTDESLQNAIETAELSSFIDSLPNKLNTLSSERGMNLSGGQKQRIMLARALALDPKILLLDDFTSRVDTNTEQSILHNLRKNYPGLTLISITQKISSIKEYDQIILLMEGEVLDIGTHEQLMASSPEYVQIFNSQQSSGNYEV